MIKIEIAENNKLNQDGEHRFESLSNLIVQSRISLLTLTSPLTERNLPLIRCLVK